VPGCVVRGLRKGRGTACTQQQQVARPLHGGLACAWVVRPGRGRMGSTDGNMERLAGSQAMAIGTRSTMPQPEFVQSKESRRRVADRLSPGG
jgi:hypothetical protein